MGDWTPAGVLAASRAFDDTWLPPAAEVVRTDDYVVVCRPVHLTSLGSSQVQASIKSTRPFGEIRPPVERVARAWGAEEVRWRTGGEVAGAAGTSLRRAGASLVLTELVLALGLGDTAVPAWRVAEKPPGIATTLVTDREALDALIDVETTGWNWPRRSSDAAAEQWTSLRADLESSSAFALLATVDGQPASVARVALRDSVARLYGSVTLPAFRHRGLYRALLAARCELARENGASLALTKGNRQTSAPILQRLGFERYATEQCWQLRIEMD